MAARTRVRRGNLSAALDDLITAALAGRLGAPAPVRSVVGTIDLPADDPQLEGADETIRELYARSVRRADRRCRRTMDLPLMTRDAGVRSSGAVTVLW